MQIEVLSAPVRAGEGEYVCSKCEEPMYLEDRYFWCINVECSMCRIVLERPYKVD